MTVLEERITTDTLLTVSGLTVAYGGTRVVHGVDFTVGRGRTVAVIGESGSGKSTIAKAVLGLLPAGSTVSGSVDFAGDDLVTLPDQRFRALRGRRIGFIPQDPATALNPVRTIGSQALEAAALTDAPTVEARRAAVLAVFERVGLTDPERVWRSYPHELSGGMLQRVLIGLTVLPEPDLVVADEPTSALDVTIQKRILDLLQQLRAERGISLLFITHDLAVAAERADDLVVLRDGVVEEQGPAARVFRAPRSEYARLLRADVPALSPDRYRSTDVARSRSASDRPAHISVSGVARHYGHGDRTVRAVDGVSFDVRAGTTHALVGESGSGKTTTVRMLLGLERPDAGRIAVDGVEVHGRSKADLRRVRRQLQLVYQNPFTSLDPTWQVRRIVGEPLDRFRVGTRASRAAAVREALDSVGLDDRYLRRRPTDLSGGQRQRVAIARALVLRPEVVVLDEPTSALDVTVQAGIIGLLTRLQRELGLTYLFVSHDLALVRQVADTVTVLRHGRVVESGPVRRVFHDPRHEYTRSLLDAVPAAS
ncbi:ABC transporter ATP-binding protein [Curtobacterium sp. A7_M15]|uniref:dipeptide ABC transporter ATP-binding protein n=1 Tax=Curtobacterium sp. A7_M15 TaxID=3065241 RepID=UPI0027379A0C|nr:ABC transporter ATP-binding protein [Curtobacterium sp. A7_M15]MDP4332851.1 ABC transporter ATP-binding protein [Curtobacterium sp. A7_M15]